MSEATQRPPVTPEEVWAILREVSASQRETDRRMQETDRQMQETDRRMQETDRQMQETDRRMQQTDRQLRRLEDLFNGQWGKLMEALVEGDLVELLSQRGIDVDHTVCNLKSKNGAPRWEIDIIAANGDEVVAVEVKTTLKVKQVTDFIETLKVFPEEAPTAYRGKRTYGAVAYLKADEAADVYAERQGLYVIRATGSSASITNQEDFKRGRSADSRVAHAPRRRQVADQIEPPGATLLPRPDTAWISEQGSTVHML